MSALPHLAERFVRFMFWYCCDFMVNLANLTGTSYDEANTWVLLLGIPGLLTLLVGVRIMQRLQLRKLRAGRGRTSTRPS